MSDFKYKTSGTEIQIGDSVTVPSLSIHGYKTNFIVNGYIVDENLIPSHQVDLISLSEGGEHVQLRVNIDLIQDSKSKYTLKNL